MNTERQTNEEPATLWNGVAGRAWVEMQALLDQVMQPFERLLADAVAGRRPTRVLDVGCGTGATTIAAARALGSGGSCLGVDVSEPMLALARTRAEREGVGATFVRADAQTHAFERSAFEMILSRFGVMFFDDPVAAFANLRRAAAQDAELRCLTWRGAAENPFMLVAERAAAPLLPNVPPRDPDAPGQFAFADPRRRRRQPLLGDGRIHVPGVDSSASNNWPAMFRPNCASSSRMQVGLVTFTSVSQSPITSRPTNSMPRRFISGPTCPAIQRSRSVSGRASPRPPAARLPRNSSPCGIRARQ